MLLARLRVLIRRGYRGLANVRAVTRTVEFGEVVGCVFTCSCHHVLVKIFGNGVKIAWNGKNQEGAICTHVM